MWSNNPLKISSKLEFGHQLLILMSVNSTFLQQTSRQVWSISISGHGSQGMSRFRPPRDKNCLMIIRRLVVTPSSSYSFTHSRGENGQYGWKLSVTVIVAPTPRNFNGARYNKQLNFFIDTPASILARWCYSDESCLSTSLLDRTTYSWWNICHQRDSHLLYQRP